MAAEWGIPPWQVEAECSQVWYERWKAYARAKAEAAKSEAG